MQWQQREVHVVVKVDCFLDFHRQLSAAERSLADSGSVESKPRPLFKLGVALGSCSSTDVFIFNHWHWDDAPSWLAPDCSTIDTGSKCCHRQRKLAALAGATDLVLRLHVRLDIRQIIRAANKFKKGKKISRNKLLRNIHSPLCFRFRSRWMLSLANARPKPYKTI